MAEKLPSLGGNAIIASIFPLACPRVVLPHGDGSFFMSEYSMPACPKGEVKTLVVWDAFEKQQDLQKEQRNGQPYYIPVPVLATGPHGIGADLVRSWASSLVMMGDGADAGPGIMVIATNERNPENVKPTPEQLAEMKARQARWFDALYYEGDQIFNDKDSKQKGKTITVLHRAAAAYLGRKPAWTDQVQTGEEIVDCPACFQKIKAQASICFHCKAQIRALPSSIASLPGNADMHAEERAMPIPIPPPVKAPGQSPRA